MAENTQYDYIVVGSGAGGGPLACNLAKAGKRVLLMEAGEDHEKADCDETNVNYSVPAFHGFSTEDENLSWEFFVRHYGNIDLQEKDNKFEANKDGVFYPRAGTLGGCTAHYAMIIMYPHHKDWDDIAELTGDPSWSSKNMWQYFERMQEWLPVDQAGIGLALNLLRRDPQLRTMALSALKSFSDSDFPLDFISKSPLRFFSNLAELLQNPNSRKNVDKNDEGVYRVPIATQPILRAGTREYINKTKNKHPGFLDVMENVFVTKVIFDGEDDGKKIAVGIEYIKGKDLYKADPLADKNSNDNHIRHEIRVRTNGEVILSGGAFNTPQILMLSGVGSKEALLELDIVPQVELPGVGKNLQDRYEVGVIYEMKEDFKILKDVEFKAGDSLYKKWEDGEGFYTTNGAVLSIIKKSTPEREIPDLFIFGLPGHFEGYKTGWSKKSVQSKRRFTWVLLKAHTNNSAGEVTLTSSSPLDMPKINFKYFDEGNDISKEDLESVVEGIKFIREMSQNAESVIKEEVLPGKLQDDDQKLGQFVKNNAWGHHASCTCKIGPDEDKDAVLDSNFCVKKTKNLRVVDASVFPKIPGFFIVTPVYMISEKASEVILKEASEEE
jgi:choline dehydrogenase